MSQHGSQISDSVRPIIWSDDSLQLLDQRRLPQEVRYLVCNTAADVAFAIRQMVVRGAPAIGITAAYGAVLAAREAWRQNRENWQQAILADLELLAGSRPTAVNLQWALSRMQSLFAGITANPVPVLLAEAGRIHTEDINANQQMGRLGAALLGENSRVLTHCNTGSLATGGFGTALGVIRTAWQNGLLEQVYAGETRPWFQGARLTAWELAQDRIPVTLIADSAAAYLMSRGQVNRVIVGADRIVANGDVANKIGTYSLAVAARYHGIGLMVVAPSTTFDLATADGSHIPIEDRGPSEIVHYAGQQLAPAEAAAWNPVFDITPANLVDVIVTEKGVIHQPDRQKIADLLG
ncbi:MAG TPA: S-methyl-5-thioribose-1-phosphate isomerase [Gammaproteobacteria bacterium]|nr:S-methyl-5-thioribose-1-phosphate isomerase [Gammaproteobacteria bacterium]